MLSKTALRTSPLHLRAKQMEAKVEEGGGGDDAPD